MSDHFTSLIDEIAALNVKRVALCQEETRLHDAFMAAPSGSDAEKAAGRALDALLEEFDNVSDQLGRLARDLEDEQNARRGQSVYCGHRNLSEY